MKTVNDMDFNDKVVLMRVGFDVPVDKEGNVLDDRRIRVAIPTIEEVLQKGAKQIILCWHVGRPKNNEPYLRTNKIAQKLSRIMGEEVTKIDDWGEEGIPQTKLVALENLRFHPGEKSNNENERDMFGKELAGIADVYVNEAFSNCHRDHASITSVPKFIPGCIGLNVEKEINAIEGAIKDPKRPLISIFGGLKADKINALYYLRDKSDYVLVGGALAFLLLKARGIDIGSSKIDKEGLVPHDLERLSSDPKVILPSDCVIADKFNEEANSKIVPVEFIEKGWMALDIGPDTIDDFKDKIETAGTILWFGPIGVFEMEKFSNGTRQIANALAICSADTIIGGGDSANAINSIGLGDKMTHMSTGGGASLQLIQGLQLAGIRALEAKDTTEES